MTQMALSIDFLFQNIGNTMELKYRSKSETFLQFENKQTKPIFNSRDAWLIKEVTQFVLAFVCACNLKGNTFRSLLRVCVCPWSGELDLSSEMTEFKADTPVGSEAWQTISRGGLPQHCELDKR